MTSDLKRVLVPATATLAVGLALFKLLWSSTKSKDQSDEIRVSLVADLKTPAFVVDIDVLERNCAAMRSFAQQAGVELRPHVKTHKCIEAGVLQCGPNLSPNRRKIVVSTLAEAWHFARGGFQDILFAVPLDPHKLGEIAAISRVCRRFHVLVDHPAHLAALEDDFQRNQRQFSVFIKVDTGYHRAGVDPSFNSSFSLVQSVFNSAATHLQGIYSHSGHSYHHSRADRDKIRSIAEEEWHVIHDFAENLRALGVTVPSVSVGATPSLTLALQEGDFSGCTEIHPGNYCFFDTMQHDLGSCEESDIASFVLTRVISHYPERNEFMVDAGALALSKEQSVQAPHGFGSIVGYPDLVIRKISQEEGIVCSADPSKPIPFDELPIGSAIKVLPVHSCLTAACFSTHHIASDDRVIDKWQPCREW